MNPYLFIDYIGLYAPILLFILSLWLLRNMKTYLFFFLVGFIFNNGLNILLKLLIQQPRPTNDQKAIEIGVVNGARIGFDKFGMPSGHAQNGGFCLSFITMALNNPSITTLYSVISFISLVQRYMYNNHSILQLIIGFIIGLLFGYMTYIIGNKYIVGNMVMKKDDYGPK